MVAGSGEDGSSSDDLECSEDDRTTFNSNLFTRFQSEYDTLSTADKRRLTTGIGGV